MILGVYFKKKKIDNFYRVSYEKKLDIVTIIIIIGYIIEFMYFRNIPLLGLLFGGRSTLYKDFGIPVFHVFLATFNAFFAVYIFHVLLSIDKKRRVAILFFILLIPSLLVVNRGLFLMILVSCLFIFLFKIKKIKLRTSFLLLISILLLLYFFGIFGNIRVNNSYKRLQDPFDNTVIFMVGGANDNFIEKKLIPKPYFWSYIYIASPLANFQETVNDFQVSDSSFLSFPKFVTNQLLPDFIGKRINSMYGWEKPTFAQISEELNVGTIYASGYAQLGWFGVIFIFLYLIVFSIIYIYIISKLNSAFFLTGLAILSTIFVFSGFSNMLTFSGLSFQLVYPLFFSIIKLFGKKQIN